MHKYLYRKLRDYLDLYIRSDDSVVEIDAKGMSESLGFQNKNLLVFKSGSSESWTETCDLEFWPYGPSCAGDSATDLLRFLK